MDIGQNVTNLPAGRQGNKLSRYYVLIKKKSWHFVKNYFEADLR